jgi:nitroreductase
MVRNFRADPVDDDVLDRVLDAGRRGPTAGFSQGYDFLVLRDESSRAQFWDLSFPPAGRERYPWPGLFEAPVVVVPVAHLEAYLARYRKPDKQHTGLGDSAERWPVPYWLTDTAMAVENMLLAAVDEGLGALFFGLFGEGGSGVDEAELLRSFGIPEDRKPLGALAIGHPGDVRPSQSVSRGRREREAVLHYERW